MKIKIISIGKIKETFYLQAQAEYVKLLGRYCDVIITEVAGEPLDGVRSEKQLEAAREAEGRRARQKLTGFVVACDMSGRKLTSEGFSRMIEEIMQKNSTVTFVTGGSAGLSRELLDAAGTVVSFSDMTLPHRLFRIVLLEQVYRAFKIMRGETYHK